MSFDSDSDLGSSQWQPQQTGEGLTVGDDVLMEQILENINNTPIGQVLSKIAALPDTRRGKILDVRHQLVRGEYDLNERLDVVLEKVLEDIGP